MNKASAWAVGIVWADATMVAGWALGDLQGAMLLAVGSGVFLWLFLALWQGSTLVGALLTFGVPTLMVVTGGLLFGMGHRWAGNTLMIGSAAVFALLGYWVFTRWGNGAYVAGFAPDGTDGEFVTNEEWVKRGWGRGKAGPDLPNCGTSAAICPFMDDGAINPNAGRDDSWKGTRSLYWPDRVGSWTRQ